MANRHRQTRLAGLFYLILVISGILTFMVLPGRLITWDDPAQTLASIQEHGQLYRWWIVTEVVMLLAFTFLPLALYRFLRPVHALAAALMVILVAISLPISFSYLIDKMHVLTLLGDDAYLQEADASLIQFEVMNHLRVYSNGIKLVQIFWGLWLLPFGYLVYRSGFLPRILGIFLMVGCLGYLVTFFGELLVEHYSGSLASTIAGIPASVGEIGICLWMLIMGARQGFRST